MGLQWLFFILTGLFAGVCSGIFGVGGGVVVVPILILAFGYSQHAANGTSLVALLLPVGILGVMSYYQAGKIGVEQIKAGLAIAVGILMGTYLGAQISVTITALLLRRIFAFFLVAVAVRLWLMKA